MLREDHFAALNHMGEALRVEALLGELAKGGAGLSAEACAALTGHTFFCFNASGKADTILPVTALGGAGGKDAKPFMLLYTCEMVLEQASHL